MAPTNGKSGAEDAALATTCLTGDPMKVQDDEHGAQSRVASFRWARGHATAVIEVRENGCTTAITLHVSGACERKALALCGANARLLAGAIVMDGCDVLAIRDSLDNSRGLMGEFAPQEASATLAIAAIEAARGRLPAGNVA